MIEKSVTLNFRSWVSTLLIFFLFSVVVYGLFKSNMIDLQIKDLLSDQSTMIEELKSREPRIVTRETVRSVFLSRMEVNTEIRRRINLREDMEPLYALYDEYTLDRELTTVLVSAALVFEVPVHLFLGLIRWESNFNPEAVNVNSSVDKPSEDWGLGQLNSRSFPDLTKIKAFQPVLNARLSAAHLRERYHDSWEIALVRYNGGWNPSVVQWSTIRHMVSVLEFEREFDRRLSELIDV